VNSVKRFGTMRWLTGESRFVRNCRACLPKGLHQLHVFPMSVCLELWPLFKLGCLFSYWRVLSVVCIFWQLSILKDAPHPMSRGWGLVGSPCTRLEGPESGTRPAPPAGEDENGRRSPSGTGQPRWKTSLMVSYKKQPLTVGSSSCAPW